MKLFTPILSHVNENENNLAKVQNLKFHNSFNNFDRAFPRSMHDSRERIL